MSGVRRQLLSWTVYSLGLLLVSSMCGYLVRAMNPRLERYTPYQPYYPPQPPARADLANRAAPAFGRTMTPTPADAAEFAPVFDGLAAAARAGDGAGYAALWDCDREAEEEWALVAKWTGSVPTDRQVRESTRDNYEMAAARGRDRAVLFRFDRTELIKLARSRDGREAQVLARHLAVHDGVPVTYGMRWWLVRGGGGWRAYDFDDPSTRMRKTVMNAGFEWEGQIGEFGPDATAPPPPGEPPLTAARAVVRALLLTDQGMAFELDSTLAACRGAKLPPPLAAGRAVAEAQLRLWQGKPQEATPFLDEATRLDPTYPLTL